MLTWRPHMVHIFALALILFFHCPTVKRLHKFFHLLHIQFFKLWHFWMSKLHFLPASWFGRWQIMHTNNLHFVHFLGIWHSHWHFVIRTKVNDGNPACAWHRFFRAILHNNRHIPEPKNIRRNTIFWCTRWSITHLLLKDHKNHLPIA